MDAPADLKKAVEGLLASPDFLNSIAQYTRSALQTLYGLPQSHQIHTPASYTLFFAHLHQTAQPFNQILEMLPKEVRPKAEKILQQFEAQQQERVEIDNSTLGNLCDVKWEMFIQNGRQVWDVRLFIQEKEQPLRLTLSYEQLSALSFQVGQLASHLLRMSK